MIRAADSMSRDALTQVVRKGVFLAMCLLLLSNPVSLPAPTVDISFSWDLSTDTTVAGYNVYYGNASGLYNNVVSTGNTNSTVISNLVSGATYYFAATSFTFEGLESDFSTEAVLTIPPASGSGSPPLIDPPADLVVGENAGLQTVALTGISSSYSNTAGGITVTAISSNPDLIPNPRVNYTSPAGTGILDFTPAPNAFGTASVTVSVRDDQPTNNSTSVSFQVTVKQGTLLQAAAMVGPTRTLTVLAKPGKTYQVQYATNLVRTTTWKPLITYFQTNVSQSIALDPTLPQVYYRLQEK